MRAVLMYHSIDPSGSPISVDEATFARHLDGLAAGRVRVVPFGEIASVPRTEDAVAITFDDAFESFADLAWPRLRERGLPATVFVVTGHVGGDNLWGGRSDPGIPRLPLLDWQRLGRLAEEGAELGCHSRTHPDMSRSPRTEIEAEMLESRKAIERETGVRATSFAYPYGRHGADARDLARRHFERACTTRLAVLGPAPEVHLLPRLDAWYYRGERGAARLAGWGGAAFRAHLALRAGARRLKAALGN